MSGNVFDCQGAGMHKGRSMEGFQATMCTICRPTVNSFVDVLPRCFGLMDEIRTYMKVFRWGSSQPRIPHFQVGAVADRHARILCTGVSSCVQPVFRKLVCPMQAICTYSEMPTQYWCIHEYVRLLCGPTPIPSYTMHSLFAPSTDMSAFTAVHLPTSGTRIQCSNSSQAGCC